jgi:hypothetical protein
MATRESNVIMFPQRIDPERKNPLGAHVAERHRWHDAWLLGAHIARESYSYPHRIQMFVTEL